jgi:hypothetical protein
MSDGFHLLLNSSGPKRRSESENRTPKIGAVKKNLNGVRIGGALSTDSEAVLII